MSCFNNNLRLLTLSILGGVWEKHALCDRLQRTLEGGPPDPGRLAARLIFHFDEGQPPSHKQLVNFLHADDELHQRFERQDRKEQPVILLDSPVMGRPPDKLLTFPLPSLSTVKGLQQWLGLFDHELAWFADRERRQCKVTESRLHHYRYRWIEKRSGPPRLIEIPKPRLKMLQHQILREILNRVPPHPCAQGFVRGRSIKHFVEPHLGKEVVLRLDLKDFFHTVPVSRIGALFHRLGYPWSVARLLQGLSTHASSPSLAGNTFHRLPWAMQKRLRDKHLPQGAPTSPALANLAAFRFDCRLQGVANRFSLDYTRYADDLAFSGNRELLRLAPFLKGLIGAIAIEEGFEINHRKTRAQTQAQSQRLGGMVINQRPNLPREEFDRLKAILHNCVRWGPESQNREGVDDFKAHLGGRVAYAVWLNPKKGKRLRYLWKRIQWLD
ncbi:MAG: RNA-directed DNA polymerase [gamma proteobacterium symbiont of Ctena orbiculata]|nr:MAG: RNA-directed DNA polymerase [gamma proteobacterium symbiont of Ctena orbiculata]PUB91569.1 MAG: RNA-directed DNA polymerase [gamma proteobacterium symbiont of Ctena orbiculata]